MILRLPQSLSITLMNYEILIILEPWNTWYYCIYIVWLSLYIMHDIVCLATKIHRTWTWCRQSHGQFWYQGKLPRTNGFNECIARNDDLVVYCKRWHYHGQVMASIEIPVINTGTHIVRAVMLCHWYDCIVCQITTSLQHLMQMLVQWGIPRGWRDTANLLYACALAFTRSTC